MGLGLTLRLNNNINHPPAGLHRTYAYLTKSVLLEYGCQKYLPFLISLPTEPNPVQLL